MFDAIDCKNTVHISDVPAGKQIFNYTWQVTHKANRGNGKPDERARFCIAGNEDWNKDSNVPTSPVTPQRAIRAIVAAAAIMDLPIHTEDFLRAYLQSDVLPEPIYVRIPPEAGEPDDRAWAFYRAIYGKDDAGRHFHLNVQSRFLKIPGIILSAVFDTIYLIPKHGAMATYVDDSMSIGGKRFMDAVATVMSQYKTHRVDRGTVLFAGITATSDDTGVHCSAGAYADTVSPIDVPTRANDKLPTGKDLHSLVAKLLWVGRCGRPDILTNATQLANLTAPTGIDARRANDTLSILHHRPITLSFPKLDRPTLRVSVYADYSGSTVSAFAKRQVGYIIILTDNTHRFAPLHWASHRPSRVCRGSTAGELLALADAVAASLDIRQLLEELLDQRVPLDAYTDSATAYNMVTSFMDPADMSGKNDLLVLRRSLLNGVLAPLHHIAGEHNPADPLSKPTFSRPAPNNALSTALATGILHHPTTSTTTSDGYRNAPRGEPQPTQLS